MVHRPPAISHARLRATVRVPGLWLWVFLWWRAFGITIGLTHTTYVVVPLSGLGMAGHGVFGLVVAGFAVPCCVVSVRWVWGGSAPGPSDIAGGAVGSSDLSPEAVRWVTPGDAVGHRALGFGFSV